MYPIFNFEQVSHINLLHRFFKQFHFDHLCVICKFIIYNIPEAVTQTWALTLSWRRSLSNRNQPIDLRSKSMDWFLYDNGLRHERVKEDNLKKLSKFIGKHQRSSASNFMKKMLQHRCFPMKFANITYFVEYLQTAAS